MRLVTWVGIVIVGRWLVGPTLLTDGWVLGIVLGGCYAFFFDAAYLAIEIKRGKR
jgi:hypothetical protein